MTKHIVGLIIFTLIVGTSAIIAGIFGYMTTPGADSVSVSDNLLYRIESRRHRCGRKRRKPRKPRPREISATVTQATFDEASRTLTTAIDFSDSDLFDGDLELHFFVKDAYGTQYLKKETISVSDAKSVYENTFGWLNRLESRENLYVIAQVKSSDDRSDYQPSFDSGKATPVLIKVAE